MYVPLVALTAGFSSFYLFVCVCVCVCCMCAVRVCVGECFLEVRGGERCASVLQCVAVRCSALQCVAVCCSVFEPSFTGTHTPLRNVLQCELQCELQCIVLCCSADVSVRCGVSQSFAGCCCVF